MILYFESPLCNRRPKWGGGATINLYLGQSVTRFINSFSSLRDTPSTCPKFLRWDSPCAPHWRAKDSGFASHCRPFPSSIATRPCRHIKWESFPGQQLGVSYFTFLTTIFFLVSGFVGWEQFLSQFMSPVSSTFHDESTVSSWTQL